LTRHGTYALSRRAAPNFLAMHDEIKQIEAAIYSEEIWVKALDVLRKRIASGEISDNMLLRIVVCLSTSTACFEVDRRPRHRS
jgi:hypothetical protein